MCMCVHRCAYVLVTLHLHMTEYLTESNLRENIFRLMVQGMQSVVAGKARWQNLLCDLMFDLGVSERTELSSWGVGSGVTGL